MANHQRTILLLTEWADPRFYHGVAAYAKKAGWHLNIEYIYSRKLPTTWKGDGCVHMVSSQEARDFIAALNVPHPAVVGDPVGNGTLAADYFDDLGFRHFAFYASDYTGGSHRHALRGTRNALKSGGSTSLHWPGARPVRMTNWSGMNGKHGWLAN